MEIKTSKSICQRGVMLGLYFFVELVENMLHTRVLKERSYTVWPPGGGGNMLHFKGCSMWLNAVT